MDPGRIGIWSGPLRRGETHQAVAAARQLEDLGYGTLWFPGGGAGAFDRVRALLEVTNQVVVATGILSIWVHPADAVAASFHEIDQAYPGRFLLGLGVSHAPLVDRDNPGRYRRPLHAMSVYLDSLDGAPHPVPAGDRVLAALGPRMLEMARERAAGAHPYLVPVSHTRRAREILGPEQLLLPEQAVVVETDPARARHIARRHLEPYLRLPNYTNNLRREGFSAEDFADGVTDRLVDAIVAWGDPAAVLRRVEEHFAAGANHVCIQVLTEDPAVMPLAEWRELAAVTAS